MSGQDVQGLVSGLLLCVVTRAGTLLRRRQDAARDAFFTNNGDREPGELREGGVTR